MEQTSDNVHPLAVYALLNLLPRHTATAVRIVSAFHGNLRAVIDAGRSRHRKENRKLLEILVQILYVAAKSLRVMGIQQIEKHVVGLLHITRIAAVNRILKVLVGQAFVNPEILDALPQRIIHDRVKLVSPKPGHGVVPDFSQNVNILLYGFQPASQLLAEGMGNLVCHIQPDPVHVIVSDPVFADPDQVIPHFWIVGI